MKIKSFFSKATHTPLSSRPRATLTFSPSLHISLPGRGLTAAFRTCSMTALGFARKLFKGSSANSTASTLAQVPGGGSAGSNCSQLTSSASLTASPE